MITVTFLNGCILATAEQSLWQYSYNQQLQINGLELPGVFTVDFCNEGDTTTVAMIGSSGVVDIPNELLTSGRDIVAYVFQKSALTGGITRCEIRIDVLTRPERDDETPTPEQEAVIDQYIAELNEGVEKAETAAENAETSENNAAASAADAQQSKADAAASASAAAGSASDASNSADAAAQSAVNASNSAENAAEAASEGIGYKEDSEAWAIGKRGGVDVGSSDVTYHNNSKYYAGQAAASSSAANSEAAAAAQSARDAAASASGAAQSAANATASKNAAANSADVAANAATAAQNHAISAASSATAASGSATAAANSATAAAGSATAAGTAQTAAEAAQTAAETAQDAAEDAQEAAETAAQSVSQSAAQIATNTSDISDLKSAFTEFGDDVGYVEQTLLVGKSIVNTSSNILPSSISTESGFCCCCIACIEGDKFTITGSGGNSTRLWAFSNSSGTALEVSDAQASATELILTAPANAAYFAFNSKTTNGITYSVFKGIKPKTEIQNLKNALSSQIANERVVNTLAGNYVSISDAKENVDIVGLSVDVQINQSGSGTPSTTNVRNISEYTECNIKHKVGTNAAVNQQIALSGLYAGKLYTQDGELKCEKTTELLTFDGSSDESWSVNSSGRALIRISNIYENVWGTTASSYGWSNYLVANSGDAYDGIGDSFCVSGTNLYVAITGITTVDALKTYLSSNNLQILLTLKTPSVTTLTGYTPITMQSNNNKIWTDVGDVTVNYYVDIGYHTFPPTVGSYSGCPFKMRIHNVIEETIGDISLYSFISSGAKSPQGIAAYGNYVFQVFSDLAKIAVIDIRTLELVNSFDITDITHGNVLQFVGSETDTGFPLLIVSEGNDALLKVAKISTTGCNVVGTIRLPDGSSNRNAIYDIDNSVIYVIGTSLSDYTDASGSTIVSTCSLDYSDIPTDGTEYTLTVSSQMTLPFTRVTQALNLVNGNIVKIGSNYSDTVSEYYIINPTLGLVATYTVDKANPAEVEGSCIVEENGRYSLFVTEWSGSQNVNKRLQYKIITLL